MSLTRYYDPRRVINEINDLLGASMRGMDPSEVATSKWVPATDVRELRDAFVIEADLPGINKEDIEVSMDNGILVIKGERVGENKVDDSSFSRIERTYGAFYRKFSLPDTADGDNINATFDKGVLKLNIPKKELAKPKRINIVDKENNSQI